MLGRLVAEYLGRDLKQAAVVENKAGAQGAIGAETVARSEPDGYTLLVTAASIFVLNPMLYKKLSYDPVKDFRMLALVTDLPVVMEVHPSVPAKTVAEFVAYAKQNPGKLTFGSAGIGGTIHLAGEMFKQMTGVDIVHVPYKGAGPALTDLLGGNIQLMFDTLGTALPPVKSGLLRALGVSSRERIPDLPDVPTIAESGYPDYSVSVWYGVAAPAKVPEEIAQKITGEPQPRPERRAVPCLAGEGRLSAVAAEEPGRDRQVRRRRSRALDRRGQVAQHIPGLREWFERVNYVRAKSPSSCRTPDDAGLIFIGRIRTPWTSRAGDAAAGAAGRPDLPAGDFRAVRAGPQGRRLLRKSRSDLLAATSRAATSCCKARRTTRRPAARSRCARRCGPIRSAPRSSSWSASRATRSWCAASIASTARRSSTSSPIAASSRRWRRRRPGDFETE